MKEAKREGTYEDGIRSLTGASCSVSVMRALNLPEKVCRMILLKLYRGVFSPLTLFLLRARNKCLRELSGSPG